MRALVIAMALASGVAAASPKALDRTLAEDEAADANDPVDVADPNDDGLGPTDGRDPPPSAGRVAGAPSVGEVVAAAYAAAGLDHDPARGWLRRARVSGLVPWVTLRGARETTWAEPMSNIGHSATYEVRATWRLDRLLFDNRELQVAGAEAARRRERRRLANRVIRAYFTWQRARAAAVRHPAWSSHADEAAAELDALTDGRFGEMLTQRARERPGTGQRENLPGP